MAAMFVMAAQSVSLKYPKDRTGVVGVCLVHPAAVCPVTVIVFGDIISHIVQQVQAVSPVSGPGAKSPLGLGVELLGKTQNHSPKQYVH